MTDLESTFENQNESGTEGYSSFSTGYSFFHWFMMAGFVAFYALLLPINQRWFGNVAVSALLWWTALGLGLVLLGLVVAACIVHWSAMTHAERVTRAWMISFVLLIFMGELFRRHSLWVEWMELPLTLVCGALGWWALHIGLQNHAERTNREIRERLRKRTVQVGFSRSKTIPTA